MSHRRLVPVQGMSRQPEQRPARFLVRRAPRHKTFPPLMSLSGHSPSQETKCAAVGLCEVCAEQLVRLGPHVKVRASAFLFALSLLLLAIFRHRLFVGIPSGLEGRYQLFGLDARVPQLSQRCRISLSVHDGVQNRQPGQTGEIRDYMLDVHPGKPFAYAGYARSPS